MLKSVSLLTHDFEKFTTVKQFQLNPALCYILRERLVSMFYYPSDKFYFQHENINMQAFFKFFF